MASEEYCLIGKMYFKCFYPLYPKRKTFFAGLTKKVVMQPEQTAIIHRDFFTPSALSALKVEDEDGKSFISAVESMIKLLGKDQRKQWIQSLIEILETTETYGTDRDDKTSGTAYYDKNALNRLRVFLDFDSAHLILPYCIYLIFFFAAKKVLPDEFFYGADYRRQLAEFTDKITMTYGATSKPGCREIISLACRNRNPNMYAQFSYAEMLFYGNNNGVRRDIEKAYDFYKRAAGELAFPGDDPYKFHLHPLALWSIACLYMDYHKKDTPLETCVIEEIEKLSELERFSYAIRYAQAAFVLTESAGVANTLGRLAEMSDEDLPGIKRQQEKSHLESPEYYFDYALSKGYVYAYNNLALHEEKLIFTDAAHANEHLHKYLSNLKRSAEQYEPWAANRLGEYYRTGVIAYHDGAEKLVYPKAPNTANPSLAKAYYKRAIDFFNNADSAWAYANLMIYFPEEFRCNSKLLRQYAVCVRELSNRGAKELLDTKFKEVYGISLDYFLSLDELR